MNLQQLEYIIAVDNQRHFARAAEKCFVTQPTLSMMIHKLEEELDVKIFDRSTQPVKPTREGEEIIKRAKLILSQVNHLREYSNDLKGEVSGEIKLGIIPTLAPYLLPLFIRNFLDKHPGLRLIIKELRTDEIIAALKTGALDVALLATPLKVAELQEFPLFYEEFFVYASPKEALPKKGYLLKADIKPENLLLLEEGHCLRNQVFNLCELKDKGMQESGFSYEAGSIETLINLVDRNAGLTIVPELAAKRLTKSQKSQIREFNDPKPSREISLVVWQYFPRKKVLESLKEEILKMIPEEMKSSGNKFIQPI
jgi:LysR family transcriptional regulator, hydrogen peroxide-inducible genes activator